MKSEDGSIYGTFEASLARSKELEKDTLYIRQVLQRGIEKARDVGSRTLQEVRDIMKMEI